MPQALKTSNRSNSLATPTSNAAPKSKTQLVAPPKPAIPVLSPERAQLLQESLRLDQACSRILAEHGKAELMRRYEAAQREASTHKLAFSMFQEAFAHKEKEVQSMKAEMEQMAEALRKLKEEKEGAVAERVGGEPEEHGVERALPGREQSTEDGLAGGAVKDETPSLPKTPKPLGEAAESDLLDNSAVLEVDEKDGSTVLVRSVDLRGAEEEEDLVKDFDCCDVPISETLR